MNKEQLDLLLQYVDAKIELEFARNDRDENGYTDNPVREIKNVELLINKLQNTL